MSDTPGGAPGRSSRPDLEPTINEAGARGFVVDGTDSFAVPGPADGPSAADDGVPAPSVNRTRLLVTMAAVAVGLLFVVAIGRGGSGAAEDAQVRTGQDGGPEYTLPFWNDDDDSGDEIVGAPPGPIDDDTLRLLEESGELDDDREIFTEDELLIEDELDTVTIPTLDDSEFDDFDESDLDDFDDPDDEGLPTYRPLNTVPRRATTSPRRIPVNTTPRVTTPRAIPGADDEAEPVTTPATTTPATTPATTPTTTPATQPTTPTTPTTLPPPLFPDCPASLRLWSDGGRVLATTTNGAFELAQPAGFVGAQDWRRLSYDDTQSFATGSFPGDGTFWIGAAGGIYETTNAGGTLSPVAGSPPDVRSLSVRSDPTLLIVAVTGDGGVHRFDGTAWTRLDDAPGGAGEVLMVNGETVLIGGRSGVYQWAEAGWADVTSNPVVGAPVRTTSASNWLVEGGQGVLRIPDDSLTVVPPIGADLIADDANSLSVVGDRLFAPGEGNQLVSTNTDGTIWNALGATTPFHPSAVAGVDAGLVVARTDCETSGSVAVGFVALPAP